MTATASAVLDVQGLLWATSASVIETALLRRPGVNAVEANAVNNTATVTYDPAKTSVAMALTMAWLSATARWD